MAYGFVLFGDRLVRLVIGVPVGVRVGFVVGVGVALCVLVCLNIEDVRLPAALGHEIFGQIEYRCSPVTSYSLTKAISAIS